MNKIIFNRRSNSFYSKYFDKIKNANKIFLNKTDVLDYINKREPEVLITLGAGDIDTLVTPIQQLLEKKYSVHEFKNHKQ